MAPTSYLDAVLSYRNLDIAERLSGPRLVEEGPVETYSGNPVAGAKSTMSDHPRNIMILKAVCPFDQGIRSFILHGWQIPALLGYSAFLDRHAASAHPSFPVMDQPGKVAGQLNRKNVFFSIPVRA